MLHRSLSGFSLLETLAALALLLLSVLGVYRLQLFASDNIHFAYNTGQVYELGLEASRRISNNVEALDGYIGTDIENAPYIDCNPCSSQQIAQLDLYHLKLSLQQVESASAMIHQCDHLRALCLKVSWLNTSLESCDHSDTCLEQVVYMY